MQIRRPPANYFDARLLNEIADQAAALQADSHTRRIVRCSEGKHCCAGVDFGSEGLSDYAQRNEATALIYRAGTRLFTVDSPSWKRCKARPSAEGWAGVRG